MKDPVDRAVRAIARRQPFALLWAQFSVTHLVMLGGMGILRLYQPMSAAHFWLLVAISQALVGIDNVIATKLTYSCGARCARGSAAARDERSTIAAWRALVARCRWIYCAACASLPLLFQLPAVHRVHDLAAGAAVVLVPDAVGRRDRRCSPTG